MSPIEEIKNELTDATDGPVSKFSVLYDGKDFKIGDYYFSLEEAIRLRNFLTEEINFHQEQINKK